MTKGLAPGLELVLVDSGFLLGDLPLSPCALPLLQMFGSSGEIWGNGGRAKLIWRWITTLAHSPVP